VNRMISFLACALVLSFGLSTSEAEAQSHGDRWYKNAAKRALGTCIQDARERGFAITAHVNTISSCIAGGFITEVTFLKEKKCRSSICPLGPVQQLATVEFGCDDRVTYAECTWKTCRSDADCDRSTEWCQTSQYGVGECHHFVGAGESCGGFTPSWLHDKCEPGLLCVNDPQIPDSMGVCAVCNDNGTPYMEGETFPSSDGCNTCTCQAGGLMACTKMACIDPCVEAGCSGQLCESPRNAGIITTCEWRPEYECLQFTECGLNGRGGTCAWEQTREYRRCLNRLSTRTVL
jgi:eight-cysteine-cluster-containing protein